MLATGLRSRLRHPLRDRLRALLVRGVPLMERREPLKRTPFRPTAARGGVAKGLKPRSAGKDAELAKRGVLRAALAAERGMWCEVCPVTPVGRRPPRIWCDMHERLSRARGGSPLDAANILVCCRLCHSWITTNPAEATALGLLRSRTPQEHTDATGVTVRLTRRVEDL